MIRENLPEGYRESLAYGMIGYGVPLERYPEIIDDYDWESFGIAVKLHVVDSSLPQSELESLAREAHEQICPYSHATRGNVQVDLTVQGA